ncbi:MAG: VirB4 family type IV secretion system protein [Tepidibacillus sp.]
MKFIKKSTVKNEKRPGKAQPDFMDAKPEGIDFASPSLIKETIPSDLSIEGVKINDYLVEVGGTSIPTRYFRSFFAEIMSGNTWAGMLDSLLQGNFGEGDLDLAIHVRPAHNKRELDEIERRIAGLRSDMATETNEGKLDAMRDEIQDLKQRQVRLRREIEKSFRVSIQAIASSTDFKAFKKYTNALVKRFGGKSIVLRAADGRQLDALKSILPTAEPNIVPKEHFMSFETSNLSDLFPFGNGGISHRTGIIVGKDSFGRYVWLDRWLGSLTNQHMVIIGRSGAGKTYTIMEIIHRSAHIGIRSAIVDWKGEYKDFVLASGCPYINLSENSLDRVNPYDVEVTEEMDGTKYVAIEEAANFVQALVFKMISIYDRNVLTGEVKVFIGNSIREQYREKGITREVSSLYDKPTGGKFNLTGTLKAMPELSGLYLKMSQSIKPDVKKAAELLKNFTKHGEIPSYAIFDGQSTVQLKNAPIIGFGINKLDKEIMRPIGLIAVTKWLDEKFVKANTDQKKNLIIEEAQNIFNDQDVGSVWAESAYREGRWTNTGVVAVTQGLEVFTQSKAGIAALKNSPVKLIGIQESVDIDSVQGILALSEGEADFLVYQATKGNMVLKIDNESTIVTVDASEHEHMLFTTDPNDPAYYKRKEYMKQRTLLRRQSSEKAG